MEAAVGTVGILGFGRFGRSLGELMAESGIRVRAFDPHATVPAQYAAGRRATWCVPRTSLSWRCRCPRSKR